MGRWILALLLILVSYFGALFAVMGGIQAIAGFASGTKPSPDDIARLFGAGSFGGHVMTFVPLFTATFIGTMTAPRDHRGMAAILVPVLVFSIIVLMMISGSRDYAVSPVAVSEEAIACALAGVFAWRLRQA